MASHWDFAISKFMSIRAWPRRSIAKEGSLVVAKGWRFKLDEARQRFRLTSTEKRVIVFVLAAFVLGLATKCYRESHPSPAPAQSDSR